MTCSSGCCGWFWRLSRAFWLDRCRAERLGWRQRFMRMSLILMYQPLMRLETRTLYSFRHSEPHKRLRRAQRACEERSGARGPRERRAGVRGGAPFSERLDFHILAAVASTSHREPARGARWRHPVCLVHAACRNNDGRRRDQARRWRNHRCRRVGGCACDRSDSRVALVSRRR